MLPIAAIPTDSLQACCVGEQHKYTTRPVMLMVMAKLSLRMLKHQHQHGYPHRRSSARSLTAVSVLVFADCCQDLLLSMVQLATSKASKHQNNIQLTCMCLPLGWQSKGGLLFNHVRTQPTNRC